MTCKHRKITPVSEAQEMRESDWQEMHPQRSAGAWGRVLWTTPKTLDSILMQSELLKKVSPTCYYEILHRKKLKGLHNEYHVLTT